MNTEIKIAVLGKINREIVRTEDDIQNLQVDIARWEHNAKRTRTKFDKYDRQELTAWKNSVKTAKVKIKDLNAEAKYWEKLR